MSHYVSLIKFDLFLMKIRNTKTKNEDTHIHTFTALLGSSSTNCLLCFQPIVNTLMAWFSLSLSLSLPVLCLSLCVVLLLHCQPIRAHLNAPIRRGAAGAEERNSNGMDRQVWWSRWCLAGVFGVNVTHLLSVWHKGWRAGTCTHTTIKPANTYQRQSVSNTNYIQTPAKVTHAHTHIL